jgi:hypothetical protein
MAYQPGVVQDRGGGGRVLLDVIDPDEVVINHRDALVGDMALTTDVCHQLVRAQLPLVAEGRGVGTRLIHRVELGSIGGVPIPEVTA